MPIDIFEKKGIKPPKDILSENVGIPNYPFVTRPQTPFEAKRTAQESRELGRDVLSGIATTGQNLANFLTGNRGTQYNFSSENTNPLAEKIGEYLPATIAGGTNIIPQMFAQGLTGYINAEPGQKNLFLPSGKVGSAVENALLSFIPLGAAKATKYIYKGLSRSRPDVLAKSLQQHHDILEQSAINDFSKVGEEVTKRNINKIPLDKKIISDLHTSGFFPKTRASKKLIKDAESGDYEALRKIQSELFHRGNKKIRSPYASESDVGEEMHDLRDKINESISAHLKKTGNEDLDKILNQGKNKYFDLKKFYYSKPVPPAVKKLVNKEYRKIPKNIFKIMSEESKPINALKEVNPEIDKLLTKEKERVNALSTLKKIGYGGVGLGALEALTSGKSLFDLIKKNNQGRE